MQGIVKLAALGRGMLAGLGRAWSQFWFEESPTSPLELTRIGVGAALLVNYALATPFLFDFWGEEGFVPRQVVLGETTDPWIQSALFYFNAPWQWTAFHFFFLLCCAAFMAGWRTSLVKWLVLIGHISYAYREPVIIYGVDALLASLLFILCVAPSGCALSLDRVRAVRAAKRADPKAVPPPYRSAWAGACIRLMQIQMAVIFFYSGIAKLKGEDWWDGEAIWLVFITGEHYSRAVLDVLASHYWLVNVGTYGTILIELAFPFLIWQRATRPYLLGAAIMLHVMFAVLMGLYYFSFVMVMGHMSFVRPEWLARVGEAWKRGIGTMPAAEMAEPTRPLS
jgi:HTTM domain